MKKITLEKLIYKNYLKTSLVSILFIELVLVIIYFTVNSNIIEKSIDFILEDIKHNTQQLVNEKSKSIDKKIAEIETLARIVQKEHRNFFEYPQTYNLNTQLIFDFAKNGMYYKLNNNGGSSLVVSKDTKITPDLKEELIQSEIFDSTFKTLVNHDKDIVAAYYNSHKNYNRYYPFLEDVYTVFPPDIKMENYNFYYLADNKYNPKKDVVLTDVYLDPAKQGWLLSAIVPIYKHDILEGVSGLDISLNNFINSFLNLDLPYEGKSFILNKNGKIVAMPKEIEKILNIKELSTYKYKTNEKINSTIYKSNKFSILDYPDKKVAEIFKNIVENKSYPSRIEIAGKKYLLFMNKVKKTSWISISLISEDKALKEVKDLESYYNKIGIIIIIAIFIFYAIFFLFLQYKANEFVKQINNPLKKIINLTKYLPINRDVKKLEPCGIFEIDKLNSNFNNLSEQLSLRTQKLIEEETKRIYHEKLANTDPLTGAYNRRFLNEFATEYIKTIRREKTDLSIMMIDLDDFKNINDTFGHETGDDVIKQLVMISREIIRENDLIIRLGGDEFVILLPNTNTVNAKIVAKKIVSTIYETNKNKEVQFTVSIGISQFEDKDTSIKDMMSRADSNLYKAKKTGKNCII